MSQEYYQIPEPETEEELEARGACPYCAADAEDSSICFAGCECNSCYEYLFDEEDCADS